MSRLLILQIYIFIIYILSALELIKPKLKKINMNIIVLASGFIFLTLDEKVPDLINYEIIYYKLPTTMEKGYVLLNKLFKENNFSFMEFRIAIGIVVTYLIYRAFTKLTMYPSITFLCYMQYNFLEKPYIQIRNAFSIAIFLNVIEYFVKRRRIKGILGTLISYQFHKSAAVYFIVTFFDKIKFSKKKIIGYFILVVLLSILVTQINLDIFFNLLLKLPFKGITEKIMYHFIKKESQITDIVAGTGIRMWISYLLFSLLFRYLIKKVKNRDNYKLKIYSYIYLFQGIVVLFKSLSYNFLIFTRIVGCFDFAEVIIVSWLIEKQKNNIKKQIYLFIVFLYVMLSCYKFGLNLGIW